MLAFNQTLKSKQNSSIYTNNITDQFYEPLRIALRKSSLTKDYLQTDKRRNYELSSPNGKKMRVFSPTQAEQIKNDVYIPMNKELVPTRNILKIMRKSFTPIDFTEKIGDPITPQTFNAIRKGGVVEIVYEIRQQDSCQMHSSREFIGPFLNMGSSMDSKATGIENITKLQELPKPLFVSHSSKQLVPGQSNSICRANSTCPSKSRGSPAKQYIFKTLREGGGSETKRIKEQYKYNIFSFVDEPFNSNCQGKCCSINQVIPKKIAQRIWD